jgi:hypothetical protein
MNKQPLGYVLYQGPSALDGQPIVAIATMSTKNPKTGPMVQVWILRADMAPVEAGRTGADASVCGGCPLRRNVGGSCYVQLFRGPRSVYDSWKRGNYSPLWSSNTFAGLPVRLGAYGDPAALPLWVLSEVTGKASMHTGYTHQWRTASKHLRQYVMASCETPKQAAQAQAMGWRTFRVKTPDSENMAGELTCHSEQLGITCQQCGLCAGGKGPNVSITVHGAQASKYVAKFEAANLIPVKEVA